MVYLPTQYALSPTWMPPSWLKAGPVTPMSPYSAYQLWLQMVQEGAPASSPSPACTDWKVSM